MDIFIISGNGEQSIPEGDGVTGKNSSDGNKSDTNSGKSHPTNLDWREFRAKLYRDELVLYLFIDGISSCHLLFFCGSYMFNLSE